MLNIFKKDYVKVSQDNYKLIEDTFNNMAQELKVLRAKEKEFDEGNEEYRGMIRKEKELKVNIIELQKTIKSYEKEIVSQDNYISLFVKKIKNLEQKLSGNIRYQREIVNLDYEEKSPNKIEGFDRMESIYA